MLTVCDDRCDSCFKTLLLLVCFSICVDNCKANCRLYLHRITVKVISELSCDNNDPQVSHDDATRLPFLKERYLKVNLCRFEDEYSAEEGVD